MKENIPEWLYNTGLMTVGYYARVIFGGNHFTWKQLLALYGVGLAIVAIVNQTNISSVYKLSITLVSGIVLPNIIKVIIRSADKSEGKAVDNLSKKIDKFTD